MVGSWGKDVCPGIPNLSTGIAAITSMHKISCSWRWRPFAFEAIVDAATKTFSLLQAMEFDQWYHLGFTRNDAKKFKVEPTRDALQEELNIGANRVKGDTEVSGYQLSYWDGGNDEESCNITLLCGGENRWRRDSIVLELASSGPKSLRGLGLKRVEDILEQLIRIWIPDLAILRDTALNVNDARGNRPRISMGRLMYLNSRSFSIDKTKIHGTTIFSVNPIEYVRISVCEETDEVPSPECISQAKTIADSIIEVGA